MSEFAARSDECSGLFVVTAYHSETYPNSLLRLIGDGTRDKDGGYMVETTAGPARVDGTDVIDLGPLGELTARAVERRRTALATKLPTPPDEVRLTALHTAMRICTPHGHPGRDVRTVLNAATTIDKWLRAGRLPDDATDSRA